MSMMQRRRMLMSALGTVPKVLPNTVIWENKVTGNNSVTIQYYGDSHEYPMAAYDIFVYVQRLSANNAGACVIALSSPLDFSLCTVLKCEYRLAPRSEYSGAVVRMGLGTMPHDAQAYLENPTMYLPAESAWEITVPSSALITTATIAIPADIGAKVPMFAMRTAATYTGGYVSPLKIWVE